MGCRTCHVAYHLSCLLPQDKKTDEKNKEVWYCFECKQERKQESYKPDEEEIGDDDDD